MRLPDDFWAPPAPPLRRDLKVGAPPLPVAASVVRAPAEARTVPVGRLVVGFAAIAAIGVGAALVAMPSSTPVEPSASTYDLTTSAPFAGRDGFAPLVPDPDADEQTPGAMDEVPDAAHDEDAGDAGDSAGTDDRSGDGDHSDGGTDEDGGTENGDGDGRNEESNEDHADEDGGSDDGGSDDDVFTEPRDFDPWGPEKPPPSPPPPSTTDALAFVDLQEHHTVNLPGIKVLSSCTLIVAGEPGATADVTYGRRDVGSVTFNVTGRASIEISGSVLYLINPKVRVAYSDGAAGDPIEARRNSI